jgi:hypothetical protein
MTGISPKQLFRAAAAAMCVASLAWVGVRHVSYIEAIPGLEIFLGIIAMPGTFVEVVLEVLFSPQGFHDGKTFAWIVPPSNLILYFALALFLIKSFEGRSQSSAENS